MSDLFHEQVPFAFIQEVFRTMVKARWHTFQIITKRAKRLSRLADELPQASNIWLGVSIEHQDYVRRADELRKVKAQVRFISCEPLLGPIDLDLTGIHWLIVGGESGPNARPMKEEWVRSLQTLSREANIPFFFKQWGGALDKRGKDKALLDGRLYREWPSTSSKLAPSKYFPRELEFNLA